MTKHDFLEGVRRIAASNPSYRTGGDGSDGTCDCVGLIMGALGGEFEIHSSNYFARRQMRSKDQLIDESQLHAGSIVYKSRRDRGDLNERYKEGGRYYDGDLLDYYHIGVVASIEPLTITHCTSTNNVNGITTDGTIREWSHFGDLLLVDYAEDTASETTATVDLAVVYSEDGKPVRMRSKPTTEGEYNTITKVPYSAPVRILEQAGEWATVSWNGQRGYMMSKYLRVIGTIPANPDPETEQEETVTITISANAAAELLKALGGVL